jgi:cytochrome c oxidase subunit 3
MIGYVTIRLTGANVPDLGQVQMPAGLWASTAVILLSSITFHFALQAIRREQRGAFKTWIFATGVLSLAFLGLQVPSLLALMSSHGEYLSKPVDDPSPRIGLYGLVVFMVIIHGLHVVGGLVPLGFVTAGAIKGSYDHEHHPTVRFTAMYWHFLDAVWLVMFATLWALG